MHGYMYVDFCGSRAEAAQAVAATPLLRVSRRVGPNTDLMLGAPYRGEAAREAVRAELLRLGDDWSAADIADNCY